MVYDRLICIQNQSDINFGRFTIDNPASKPRALARGRMAPRRPDNKVVGPEQFVACSGHEEILEG